MLVLPVFIMLLTFRRARPKSIILREEILFRYGELIRLSPGGGGRCGRERGMGGQDGLRAGADAR